jgi:cytochrome P450
MISCAMRGTHHDHELYDDPDNFRPWRFVGVQDETVEPETRNRALVAVSTESLGFGLGRHAW